MAAIASKVGGWSIFWSQSVHAVICHDTAGILEKGSSFLWKGAGSGTQVGSGKVLVITFQTKILGEQDYLCRLACGWSLRAGDQSSLSWVCLWCQASADWAAPSPSGVCLCVCVLPLSLSNVLKVWQFFLFGWFFETGFLFGDLSVLEVKRTPIFAPWVVGLKVCATTFGVC